MSWIARLFKSSRPSIHCPKCEGLISPSAIYRMSAMYCDHCGTWLATSNWLPNGSFNWGLVFERLADLLTEPSSEYMERAQAGLTAIQSMHSKEPEMLMAGFLDRLGELSIEQIQKAYVDTFERTPSCSLLVSKSMYGFQGDQENFLVRISRELDSKGVKVAPYPPDHLSLCLRAMSRGCTGFGEHFALVLAPAVSKIVTAMRSTDNVYENLLMTVEWVVTPR